MTIITLATSCSPSKRNISVLRTACAKAIKRSNNNRNQFDLSLSNVKYDDWSNCACLKKLTVDIKKT